MLNTDSNTGNPQQAQQRLSHEITHELEQCLALCQQLRIDFYDCLAHARIDFERHQREQR
ncbi:hypothetical protein [Chitinibacter sp. GC72]|uniref:hypothetical protein n=1 Tax=Chitinibacter sp. GC72 TaxID=1526917 RepID=UPI0012F80345|nr:hypothetical protein [Chitinibacter sp. GC72]